MNMATLLVIYEQFEDPELFDKAEPSYRYKALGAFVFWGSYLPK